MTDRVRNPFRTDPHGGHDHAALGPNLFGNRMQLEINNDPAAAVRDWQDLERRIGSDSVSCNSEWTAAWIRHFGEIVPHRIVSAREQGIVRGMCLLTFPEENIGPFRVKTVHLGTAGEPDPDSLCIEYNRLMVDEIYRKPMTYSLLKWLRDDHDWDLLSFEGLAEEEAGVLVEAEPEFSIVVKESPYCDLRTNGQPLLSKFGTSTRSGLRRKIKQWGEIRVEWAEKIEDAERIYGELIDMHQARWQGIGMPGSFSSERFRQFHWEMIQSFLKTDRVSLVRVSALGTTIGCVLSYIERNSLLFYQMGANLNHSRLSPGMVAIYFAMEEAARRGFGKFDFLAGYGEHKRRLSTGKNRLVWANYQRQNIKLSAIRNLRQAKRIFGTP